MELAAVILAAGLGTRMKSNKPKVLHHVAGKPMVEYAVSAVRSSGAASIALVIGYGGEQVRKAVGSAAIYVEQRELLGTGHAVLQARNAFEADNVLVTYADMPLLRATTLQRLIQQHLGSIAVITLLTVVSRESMGFGRILRDVRGKVIGIVEETEATDEQLAIQELNCGIYCFSGQWMWDHLAQLKPSKKKGEYFLTDLIGLAVAENRSIEAITIEDVHEVIGINTRAQLALAERLMRERINGTLMENGVTLTDPATTYIDADVEIGIDTVIEPNTHISGKSRIGSRCTVGPNSILRDSQTGAECHIIASILEQASLSDRVRVGPFANLRPGTRLEEDVFIGNHAELKNSHLGAGVHVGHFSYVGDADVGARTNIGAGTVTCNFDGKAKHRTRIGEDAFIGSDTLLRAPVSVGAHASTGAGSVVTKDVPEGTLAVGSPARILRKTE